MLVLVWHRASAYLYEVPTTVIYPDAPPAFAFFFKPGGPLERFTGNPDSRYAVYHVWLVPGATHGIRLRHEADPARIRVYALDAHPFGRVHNSVELYPTPIQDWFWSSVVYEVIVRLPDSATQSGSYLLIEWRPTSVSEEPPRLRVQVVSMGEREMLMGRGRSRWWHFGHDSVLPPSPLQTQRPIELPYRAWSTPWERP